MLRQLLLVLVGVLLAVPSAEADWINLTGAETAPTIAEIYILDDHVKVVLEVYIQDLPVFEALVPDEWLKTLSVERPSQAERLRRFSTDTFQVVTDTGERLTAELSLIEPRLRKDRQSPFAGMINPLTRRRVPEPPADKRVTYAELVYRFERPPAGLTIVPPLDAEGRARVSIGFIAYHKAVPINDFRYLGAPARLFLNWEDPWYSRFENPNLKRHHRDALMSFLYVEPYEVRHEILTRVKDMAAWMELGLRGDRYIEVNELEPLKRRIAEFLLTRNPVRVDGKALEPILDRADYVKVALTGIQLLQQPERLEISTAIVGVIFAYLTDGMPQEVTVDWELFTDRIQRVPATAIDPAGPLLSYVEPRDRVHTWTNYLKAYELPKVEQVALDESLTRLSVPLGTVLCLVGLVPVGWQIRRRRKLASPVRHYAALAALGIVGAVALAIVPFARVSLAKPAALAPALSDADAGLILERLLKNVYRAFDFRDEEAVYDKLALTVSGDLLTDIYLQSRRSLEIKRAGGAQAKVKAVDVLEAGVEDALDRPLAYRVRGTWTVLGTVGHWGHVHTRKNRYEALLALEGVDGAWKITELELLEERRIDPASQATPPTGSEGGTPSTPSSRARPGP